MLPHGQRSCRHDRPIGIPEGGPGTTPAETIGTIMSVRGRDREHRLAGSTGPPMPTAPTGGQGPPEKPRLCPPRDASRSRRALATDTMQEHESGRPGTAQAGRATRRIAGKEGALACSARRGSLGPASTDPRCLQRGRALALRPTNDDDTSALAARGARPTMCWCNGLRSPRVADAARPG